jgi:hypothetical protein
MSTQIQPEQQQNQESNPQQNQQENLEPVVTNPPANPPQPQGRVYTEEEMRTIHELYGQTLRENEQRLQQLQAQVNQRPAQQQQSNPQEDDFLTNGRSIIAEEIDRRLQPFSQFVQQQQAQTMYASLKEQFKRHPQYSAFFNIPQAESILDGQVAQIQQTNPSAINTQGIANLITQIYGYMQLNGMVQPQQPVITNPQQQYTPVTQQPVQQPQQPMNNTNITPPHLRPSAPPMPNANGQNLTAKGNPRRPLTELERRVARENGFKNDDDYIDWLNESASNVYRSDIGVQR